MFDASILPDVLVEGAAGDGANHLVPATDAHDWFGVSQGKGGEAVFERIAAGCDGVGEAHAGIVVGWVNVGAAGEEDVRGLFVHFVRVFVGGEDVDAGAEGAESPADVVREGAWGDEDMRFDHENDSFLICEFG